MRGGRRNESGRSLSGQLHHWKTVSPLRASLIAQWGKESACKAGDPGSIPESGRSLSPAHPLSKSCLGRVRRAGR